MPATTTTVDATPTVADTVTLTDDATTRITWRVVGREQGNLDNAIYAQWTVRYIQAGGVVELWDFESSTPFDYSPSGTLTTATTSVTQPGGVPTLTVTGEGVLNILWEVKRIVEVFEQ